MSKNSIIITIIVVVLLIGAGVWWYKSSSQPPVTMAPTPQNTATNNTQAGGSVSSANPQDTSDEAINSDLSAIDVQMNGLNADSANVNQSINNQ